MKCPKCKAEMQKTQAGELEVDRCGTCGGLWFDMMEADRAKDAKGAEAVDTGSAASGKHRNAQRDIACPTCKTSMVKMAALGQPHIHYEMCSICGGAFFDAGEFKDFKELTIGESVRRFVAGLRR